MRKEFRMSGGFMDVGKNVLGKPMIWMNVNVGSYAGIPATPTNCFRVAKRLREFADYLEDYGQRKQRK